MKVLNLQPMSKGTRIVVFLVVLAAMGGVYALQHPQLVGLNEPGIVLLSALLMLAFVSLLVELSRPTL